MTEKIKLPKDDVVFKNLFSSKENKDLIKEFLEAILERKINTIEVNKEVETSIMHVEEKYGRIDLQAIINNETIVIVEMQNEDRGDIDKRAIYYAGKVIGSSLERGEAYRQMKEVVVICILNYEMTGRKEYITEGVIVENKYRKYIVIDGVKYYFIELPKYRKEVKEPKNKLEEWLAFIDYERKEVLEMAVKNNELVKKAKFTYEYLTGDEAQKRLQYLREKAERDEAAAKYYGIEIGRKEGEIIGEKRGRKEGEAIGKAKGKRETLNETAKKMLKDNLNKNIIIKYTGLSEREIDKIAKAM